jgi:predicted dehydrogenase
MNRRELIRKGGLLAASAAALPLSTFATSTPPPAEGKTGYAIVGLGGFAAYVVPRIRYCDKSKITALVTSEPDKAREWISKYKLENCSVYDYDSFSKLEKDKQVEAVYIATPVGTHAAFAKKAFEAGKHVLTEKTMAASVDQAQAMLDDSKRSGKKLMVAYRARYEPYNQACIDFVKSETYGKVVSIAAHKGFFIDNKLGKGNWRTQQSLAGGGALVDIGIYSIQACRYLAGCEPTEVFAFTNSTPGDSRFREVEENISFTLKFPNGILATGSASWGYSLQNYFRVGASKGFFQLEPATPNRGIRMQVKQEEPILMTGERTFSDVDQIPAMFDHFSECIQQNKEPKTNGEEGLKDLLVVEAIYRSARTGVAVRL